jgi:predicted NBD/HSP70 family sugar kinase
MRSRVGIDLGGSKMLLLEESASGRRITRIATGRAFSAADAEAAISRFLLECAEPPASIGIAVPGLISPDGKVVSRGGLPELAGWEPRRINGLPSVVRVLNDAEAALIEEATKLECGATVAIVVVGTYIGAAFLVEGRVLRGARGWAGELGNIPILTGSKYRILDSVAGGGAVLKAAGGTPQEVMLKVAAGEEKILDILREAGAALGAGLATIINLFNPTLVALAGGTLRWPGYIQAALETTESLSIPQLWECCTVRESTCGELLVVSGAARAAAMNLE